MHGEVVVTLVGKPGCHLCDTAREVVSGVIAEFSGHHDGPLIRLEELSILDNSVLSDEHGDNIPVVLIDGRAHGFWRIETDEFRQALRSTVLGALAREKGS